MKIYVESQINFKLWFILYMPAKLSKRKKILYMKMQIMFLESWLEKWEHNTSSRQLISRSWLCRLRYVHQYLMKKSKKAKRLKEINKTSHSRRPIICVRLPTYHLHDSMHSDLKQIFLHPILDQIIFVSHDN